MILRFLQKLLVSSQDQDTINEVATNIFFPAGHEDDDSVQILFKDADESNPDDHRIIGEFKILHDPGTPDGRYDIIREERFEVTITPISPDLEGR